jgi:hypothetical protein
VIVVGGDSLISVVAVPDGDISVRDVKVEIRISIDPDGDFEETGVALAARLDRGHWDSFLD